MLRVLLLASWLTAGECNVAIIAQGQVRGVTHEGYISYIGIPYANITDADNRFKTAGLAPLWQGIREPPNFTCTASSRVEACLQLDVHVPPSSTPLPVLVWVTGSSGQFDPGKLVQQGIIVVVVHHRLGPLGFLCLHEESIPGNAGAKDIVLALRWVRDNIVAFRGNPARVTVAGQGFAAALVEALTLSPTAQGVFHGVILQSGTAISPLAFNYDAEDRAEELAKMIRKFRSPRNDDPIEVLLKAKIVDLATKSEKLNKPYFPFGLCVEKSFDDEEQLLVETPIEVLTNKKVNSVPMIIGYNSDEAYIFASEFKSAKVVRQMAKDMAFILPEELKFFNKREVNQVLRQIRDLYFHNNVSMGSVLAFYRDAYFKSHILRSARLHAAASEHPVYLYQFSHSGFVGVEPEPGVPKTGAAHSDELAYLFPWSGREYTSEDGQVQQNLVKLWTNFVKYLSPTPRQGEFPTTWTPLDPQHPRLLSIGLQVEMVELPQEKNMRMWDDVYDRSYYGRNRGHA